MAGRITAYNPLPKASERAIEVSVLFACSNLCTRKEALGLVLVARWIFATGFLSLPCSAWGFVSTASDVARSTVFFCCVNLIFRQTRADSHPIAHTHC